MVTSVEDKANMKGATGRSFRSGQMNKGCPWSAK